MLASSLISRIRYKVGDTKATKWSDDRIIELINEGLDEMARKAYIYKSSIAIPILPYQRELVIPDENFISLLELKIERVPIKPVAFDKLNKIPKWEEDIGASISMVAYNMQNPRHLTLYPLLSETTTNYSALEDNTNGYLLDVPNLSRDYLFGIITSIDTTNTVIPINIYDPTNLSSSGGLTSISDTFIIAEVKYSAIPATVTAITDAVTIEKRHSQTLVYYVSGMLLLDDNRTESVNKGSLFIQKYNGELKEASETSSTTYQNTTVPEINYRTGF